MRKILLLPLALLFVNCVNVPVKKCLIVRKVEATKHYDSKFAIYFNQEDYSNDFILYTNTNYKVGDTLIK